jgi:hypothetical protein
LWVGVGIGIGLPAGGGGLAHAAHPLPPRFAAPAPPPRPAAPPPPVALPAGPAGCTLRATKPRDTVTLEIASGVPYARVAEIGSLEVKLPVGRDAPPAGVQLEVGNVRLRGLAAPSGLAIYPARPFVINEVLLPGPGSRLRWGDVAADRVAVALELAKESRGDVRDVKGPLRTTRPCADLRLTGRASFDSYAAVGGRGADHVAGLKSSAPVPISAQPRGPTLAKLVVSRRASLNEVTVIDEDAAGWTRIGRPAAGDLLVVGWVKQAKLGKPPARDTTFALFGETGGKRAGSADAEALPAPPFACAKELPLVAEVGQQRRTVGTIGSGVRMRASPADADHVAIVFADRAEMNVRPVSGARLLVRRSDFDGCPGFPRR